MTKEEKKERRKVKHELQVVVSKKHYSTDYRLRTTPGQQRAGAKRVTDQLIAGKNPLMIQRMEEPVPVPPAAADPAQVVAAQAQANAPIFAAPVETAASRRRFLVEHAPGETRKGRRSRAAGLRRIGIAGVLLDNFMQLTAPKQSQEVAVIA